MSVGPASPGLLEADFPFLGTPAGTISLGELGSEESLKDFLFLLYSKAGGFHAFQPVLFAVRVRFPGGSLQRGHGR
jgi:hypothetical protein